MSRNRGLIALISVLGIINVCGFFYVLSLGEKIASLSNRTAALESSLTAYVSMQEDLNSKIVSELVSTRESLMGEMKGLNRSLNNRIDSTDTNINARIDTIVSYIKYMQEESSSRYENLKTKVMGLEESTKGVDTKKIKDGTVMVYINNAVVGSGTIVSPDGYIITNKHVIEDAGKEDVKVKLYNGKIYRCFIESQNSRLDLALLKINADVRNLSYLTFEDVKNIKVGDRVYAVGNPLGEKLTEFTVTSGIISGFRREGNIDYVQTDAALNPGNSGGPLVNNAGNIVGIVSMGYINAEGLSFATRSDIVKSFLDEELP